MATTTLTPAKYWQTDYGYVTDLNPATKYITGDPTFEAPHDVITAKRAVFLEFSVPSDAIYRHAIIERSTITINSDDDTSVRTNGYELYENNGVDLGITIGSSIESAGTLLARIPKGGVFNPGAIRLIATNNKIYLCVVINGQNVTAYRTFTAASIYIEYSDGVFNVVPSTTGGYFPATAAGSIRLTTPYVADMMTQYTVASGVFYYKKTSASNYSSISFSGDTVQIPANTLEEDEEYNYYFTAVSDDGKTATSEVYSFSTGDVVGEVTALSPSNTVVYGRPTFTWLYENSLGNQQTAFDLQVSTDAVAWYDVATHEASADTAYTTDVNVGGSLYWRVRSYNQSDIVSNWSNVLSFSNVLPPAAPTITGVSGTGRITVSWNSTNQIAYQVMIGDHDSGWVYSTNKSYFLNEYLADGVYEIKVRVTNGIGLVSDWATLSYSQAGSVAGPTVSIQMQEGFNEITIAGSFDTYYIIRNGVVIAETGAGTYSDYFCNGTDSYVVRGVNADDTFGDSVLTGRYTCRKPALIAPDNSIIYINERLDEEPQISSSDTLDVVAVKYLGRTKPVHHVGQMDTRTWNVSCSRPPVPGKIYFYRNFRGDKAWVICSNVQSALNSIGVHEYQFTLEETDYSEAVEYEV